MNYDNKPAILSKLGHDQYSLSYDTVDKRTGERIAEPTFLVGTMEEIILKLVASHRHAATAAARFKKQIEQDQKDLAKDRSED